MKKGYEVLTAFNKYQLKKQIGQGGNGIVWEATDEDGDSYAIKFLERQNTEKVLKRFENETFFCMKHSHKNIVPILDYGTDGEEYVFYVMPLYKQTLRDRLRAGLSHEDVMPIFTGIIEGLSFAHKKGTIHRDIKPENILFAENSNVPIIADFGIAHFSPDNKATYIETAKGDRMANFQYAAPEQRKRGGISVEQTDIYAAGLILNEMFTGEVPQALDYCKISDVAPDYGYLDVLFEHLFKQDPSERLYPEEKIIGELQALEKRQNNENELMRLLNVSIEMQKPEDVNPHVIGLKYEKGNIIFELNQSVNDEWFNIISYGAYTHSSIMGHDTNKLMYFGKNRIAMSIRDGETEHTIEEVIKCVKSWISITNDIYMHTQYDKMKREQEAKIQENLEKIKRIEKENRMSVFLSSQV